MRFSLILALGVLVMGICSAETPAVEYLSDRLDLISSSRQGWGELGIDMCAHAPGQTPLKLRIKDVEYSKGLGHHAPGEIIVDLDGCYGAFEAEIGVQKQSQGIGSAVFQVYVDDEKRFDSGVMREQDAAKRVSIPVTGAQELRLVVTDAGDGIACDCANWANARLVPAKSPTPSAALGDRVNIAPFAQVITCDPERMDGARASRVEEFRAEDIFLETEVLPSAKGIYAVPNSCIGLKWTERRLLTEIGLRLAGEVPSTNGAQVQAWIGQTLHQGRWTPLKGAIETQNHDWVFRIVRKENPDARNGVWKVRWIFPSSAKPVSVSGFSAFTRSIWKTADLVVEIENPAHGSPEKIEAYNGEIIGAPRKWDFAKPVALKVRYCASKRSSYDRTVLRFGGFGVAVDDVLTNGCVYVPEDCAFVTTQSSRLTLAEYKKQIAGRKTVLERVREMPDQTFEQAMAKTRNPIQDNGPTMLSLACDNHKFVMEQDGTVRFAINPQSVNPVSYHEQVPCAMVPRIGDGNVGRAARHLDGGWLPIIVSAWKQGDVLYRERCFVAPYDKADAGRWLNNKSLCVAEFTIENVGTSPADASITLSFFRDSDQHIPMEVRETTGGALAVCDGRLTGLVDVAGLSASIQDEMVSIAGKLPAGRTAKCFVYLPGWEMKPEESAQLASGDGLAKNTEAYWHRVMADTMQFEIPEKLLENAVRASQVHCMIAARNEADGARVAAWAASDRYGALESESNSIIRGMDLMGQTDFARRSHDFFIKRYSPEGFLTTGYTLMGTGWQLQTLGQHYDLVRDKDWLKSHASEIARVCDWIVKQRRKTMKLDARGQKVPEYGLIPPGVMADWGNFLSYFCLSGYYYAGLHEAATALADVGYPGADKLLKETEEFRRDILDAYHRIQALAPVVPLQDGTWVRWYPSQVYNAGPLGGFFPGEDGNRSWCYDVELGAHQMVPQGVLGPDSREAAEMMDHMEDVQFLADGWFDYPAEKNHADWFNLGGFSKVQPYYCRNAEIYAMRDDVKPFIRSYFNTLASLLNTENLSLWEHFHSSGAWNKTHETGYFLQQTRFMLAMERGDRLWLAPFVTNNWLKDGMVVAVRDAPTRFGKVSYRITSHAAQGFIEMTVEPPRRNPPEEIVIRLRHPDGKRMRSVTLNGRPHRGFDPAMETITLTGALPDEVELRVEY